MTRKHFSFFISVLFLFLVCPVAFAAGTPSLAVSSVQTKAGDTVTLQVSLANNPGINTFSLGFSYDSSQMTLLDVTPSANLGGQFVYVKRAVWLNSNDSKINGDILNLKFKVSSSAKSGESHVNVTYSPGDICNYNEEDVNFRVIAGTVAVVSDTESLNTKSPLSTQANTQPRTGTPSTRTLPPTTEYSIIYEPPASVIANADPAATRIKEPSITLPATKEPVSKVLTTGTTIEEIAEEAAFHAVGYYVDEDGKTWYVDAQRHVTDGLDITVVFDDETSTDYQSVSKADETEATSNEKSDESNHGKKTVIPVLAVAAIILGFLTFLFIKIKKDRDSI